MLILRQRGADIRSCNGLVEATFLKSASIEQRERLVELLRFFCLNMTIALTNSETQRSLLMTAVTEKKEERGRNKIHEVSQSK